MRQPSLLTRIRDAKNRDAVQAVAANTQNYLAVLESLVLLRFRVIKYFISKQFQAVGHEKPCQRIAPDKQRPTPAKLGHKQPVHRNQGPTICVPSTASHESEQAGTPERSRVRVRKIVRCPATDNIKYISV